MLKYANVGFVLVTLGMASMLYNLEHNTRGLEREIAKAKSAIADDTESIKLLNAEWSSLTRPERIQHLAEQHLGMKPIEPDQYVETEELAARLATVAKVQAPESKGTIEDLLKKMQ
jgi:cell division protein FtsL